MSAFDGSASRSHVERVDLVLIAEDQFPTSDDGMTPCGRPLRRNGETSAFAISRRVRFGEPDDAILAEEIQPLVGEDERALPHAPIAPCQPARVEVQCREDAV